MIQIMESLGVWFEVIAPVLVIGSAITIALALSQLLANAVRRTIFFDPLADERERERRKFERELWHYKRLHEIVVRNEKPKREEKRKRTYMLGDDGELVEVENIEKGEITEWHSM